MEHLIDDKDFDGLLGYYADKYRRAVEKHKLSPAEACVVLFATTVDVALRTVFSEEDERLTDLDERLSELEATVENLEPPDNSGRSHPDDLSAND